MIRKFGLLLPALLLGCLGPLPLKRECLQWDSSFGGDWLPQGFPTSISHQARSAGRIPDFGPATLFIRPTELPRTPCEGKACAEFQALLAELGQPRWAPPEGSRVRLVDREVEADWVLESRLLMIQVERVLWPTVKREWDSSLLFRLRDRRSGQLIWGCVSSPEHSFPDPEPGTARTGLEARLGKHWDHLQQHLNAALNGSPGNS